MCRAVSCLVARRVYAITSVFSWQNSVSLCPASLCTPRPNLPVTPDVGRVGPSAPRAGNYTGGSCGTGGVATKKKGVEGRTERAWWQSKKRQGHLLGFLIVLFFHNLIITFFVFVRFLPTQGQFYFIEIMLLWYTSSQNCHGEPPSQLIWIAYKGPRQWWDSIAYLGWQRPTL